MRKRRASQGYVREKITLNVGDAAGIDITMEIGMASESVTVRSQTPVLDTENANLGLVINQKQVTELPLNARNPFMLAELSADVLYNSQTYWRPLDSGAIASWTVNGGINSNNEFLLDGAPNNAQAGLNNIAVVPPVDSVQEFKMQTNSFDAQYGKTSGGIMNVYLKSGTNEFHGTVYEFMRRSELDANSFQNNAAGGAKTAHFLDQYGASVGGPVRFPKLYNGRNRSFSFFNYEGYREGTPTPLTLSVPQPEMLNGDFSKLVDSQGRKITIYDPSNATINPNGTVTRVAFANNMIPTARLNPIVLKIMSYYPKSNTTTAGSAYGTNNLFIPGGSANLDRDDFYNLVLKLDQNLGNKHRLFFRDARNDRTEKRNTNGVPGPGRQGPDPLKVINPEALVLDWSGTLSPSLVIGARVSFATHTESQTAGSVHNTNFDLKTLGFPQSLISQLPEPNCFGIYSFSGYTGLGRDCGSTSTDVAPIYSGTYNVTRTWALALTTMKVTGTHALNFGADLRWIYYNIPNVGTPLNFTFDPTWTQQTYNTADALSGNSLASALLGLPASSTQTIAASPAYLYPYYALYVQDDWKLSRKLTLNLGLRYDLTLPPTGRYGRMDRGFDPSSTNPINGLIDRTAFPNFPVVKGGLLFASPGQGVSNTDMTGIQPRFGFAWQITAKLVMRGGWGRYMINPNSDSNLSGIGGLTKTPPW